MNRFFLLRAWALLSGLILSVCLAAAQTLTCPQMPDKVTQVNHDVQTGVSAGVGSLGKLKAGELGLKTDVIAKNLFDKYPNVDRVMVVQMMAATYCSLLRDSKSATDSEKLRRWEAFTDRAYKFYDPKYDPTPHLPRRSTEKGASDQKSSSPSVPNAFSIVGSGGFISTAYASGMLWGPFAGTNKMTPISIMQFYTITNLKPTPVLIVSLSIEMSGPHGWWTLTNVPYQNPIWLAKISENPRGITQMVPQDGFLVEKAREELPSGHWIKGWMLCQIPPSYVAVKDNVHGGNLLPQFRLRVRDSAGDEAVGPLDQTNRDIGNVLSQGFNIEPVQNVDLSAYEIVPYGLP